MRAVGAPWAIQLYVQDVVPVAGCQLAPLSVDTSTPATMPPLSAAVPVTVTAVPSTTTAPATGLVIVEVGGVVSVLAATGCSVDISVVAWSPMSANRFTVACCITGSGASPTFGPLLSHALVVSSPHAHWTVPAPKTCAPLGAR